MFDLSLLDSYMKNILARGGIEFLAVFLGIALSLWVDDYRESREINVRLFDDYQKIHSEVKSNIQNIRNIIKKNKDILITERYLLDVLDGKKSYEQNEIYGRIYSIVSPTFFGMTSAYKTSVSSGRFNFPEQSAIIKEVSLLYEHYFSRLSLNGDLFDNRMHDFKYDFALPFFKPNYVKDNNDSLKLKDYFFSDRFYNGLLYCHDFRKIYYMNRLVETESQLLKVDKVFKNYFASNSI